jgi:hypothetical protein
MNERPDDRHTPTAAFRARLERTIVAELRHTPPVGLRGWRSQLRGAGGWRRFRAAAQVIIALAIGAAASTAYGQVQDGRERSSLLQVAELELQVARQQEQLVRTQLEVARRRYQLGIVGRDEVSSAEASVTIAEALRRRVEINIAEIRARSAAPRDDLAAPVVGGRDFVRERLQLELTMARARMAAAQQEAEDLSRRQQLGLVSELAVMEAQLQRWTAAFAGGVHARRLEGRQEIVAGTATYADVEARIRTQESRLAMMLAVQRRDLAAARLEHVREQHRLGQADRAHLLRAELELAEKIAEVGRYEAQLRADPTRPPQR